MSCHALESLWPSSQIWYARVARMMASVRSRPAPQTPCMEGSTVHEYSRHLLPCG